MSGYTKMMEIKWENRITNVRVPNLIIEKRTLFNKLERI